MEKESEIWTLKQQMQDIMKKKDNRGGYRPGAGRPLKYGEKTELLEIQIKVPESRKAEIELKVRDATRSIMDDYLTPKILV